MPPLPKITPIRLVERAAPFNDPSCLFELKYDGFRAVAYIEKTAPPSSSRGEGNIYKCFDELCAGIATTRKVNPERHHRRRRGPAGTPLASLSLEEDGRPK